MISSDYRLRDLRGATSLDTLYLSKDCTFNAVSALLVFCGTVGVDAESPVSLMTLKFIPAVSLDMPSSLIFSVCHQYPKTQMILSLSVW